MSYGVTLKNPKISVVELTPLINVTYSLILQRVAILTRPAYVKSTQTTSQMKIYSKETFNTLPSSLWRMLVFL
jgi:hypothetical protein